MSLSDLLQKHRAKILAIATAHGAENVRVFGSVSRKTDDANSDVDLLVHLTTGTSLLDLVAIKQDVEELLGRSVHVVTDNSLSPYIKHNVLRDAAAL
jgi:uncharacterized protein